MTLLLVLGLNNQNINNHYQYSGFSDIDIMTRYQFVLRHMCISTNSHLMWFPKKNILYLN